MSPFARILSALICSAVAACSGAAAPEELGTSAADSIDPHQAVTFNLRDDSTNLVAGDVQGLVTVDPNGSGGLSVRTAGHFFEPSRAGRSEVSIAALDKYPGVEVKRGATVRFEILESQVCPPTEQEPEGRIYFGKVSYVIPTGGLLEAFDSAVIDPATNKVNVHTRLLSGATVDGEANLHTPCVQVLGELPRGIEAPADSDPQSRAYTVVALPVASTDGDKLFGTYGYTLHAQCESASCS